MYSGVQRFEGSVGGTAFVERSSQAPGAHGLRLPVSESREEGGRERGELFTGCGWLCSGGRRGKTRDRVVLLTVD